MREADATLTHLATPCLIADRGRVTRNAERMRARAAAFGVRLRPHLKTMKAAAAARIAHGGVVGPITVSTLREAAYFLAEGFTDITYAVCLTPNKFDEVDALLARGARLGVLLASADMARRLAEHRGGRDQSLDVWLEVDSGDHRTGLAPEDPVLAEAARVLHAAAGVRFAGLLTHGGHAYACQTRAAIVAVAEEERASLLAARARVQDGGVPVPRLSSGSTPTAALGECFDGIDELRPGVYLAGDLFQAQLGACTMEDVAVSVLATVIDRDRARNRVVIDAGALALSKDRSTADSPVDYGYGLVVAADGARLPGDPVVEAVSQEHGRVTCAGGPLPWQRLAVGTPVRVLPNHACMTAASYHCYWVVEGESPAVLEEWHKATGW